MYTHALHCTHICSLKTRFDHHKALGNVAAPGDRQVPLGWLACPGSSGNASDSLEVSSCVLLLCALVVCSTLHRPDSAVSAHCLHRSHIPSPLHHCKIAVVHLYSQQMCTNGLLFARGKSLTNVTLRLFTTRIVLLALGLNKNLLMEAQ